MTNPGLIIRRMRNEHGFSQTELAELMGISQPVVSRMERGIHNFSSQALVGVRDLFSQENWDYLCSLVDEVEPAASSLEHAGKVLLDHFGWDDPHCVKHVLVLAARDAGWELLGE